MPAETNTPSLLGGTENLPDRLEPNRETKDLTCPPPPITPTLPCLSPSPPGRPGGEGSPRARRACGPSRSQCPGPSRHQPLARSSPGRSNRALEDDSQPAGIASAPRNPPARDPLPRPRRLRHRDPPRPPAPRNRGDPPRPRPPGRAPNRGGLAGGTTSTQCTSSPTRRAASGRQSHSLKQQDRRCLFPSLRLALINRSRFMDRTPTALGGCLFGGMRRRGKPEVIGQFTVPAGHQGGTFVKRAFLPTGAYTAGGSGNADGDISVYAGNFDPESGTWALNAVDRNDSQSERHHCDPTNERSWRSGP